MDLEKNGHHSKQGYFDLHMAFLPKEDLKIGESICEMTTLSRNVNQACLALQLLHLLQSRQLLGEFAMPPDPKKHPELAQYFDEQFGHIQTLIAEGHG